MRVWQRQGSDQSARKCLSEPEAVATGSSRNVAVSIGSLALAVLKLNAKPRRPRTRETKPTRRDRCGNPTALNSWHSRWCERGEL